MPTNPMSIIVTYIKAYAIKNRHIELQQVNNTIEPLKRFDEKVKKLENQKLKLDGVQEYTILLTITTEQSRNNIVKYMSEDIRNIYDKFKKYKSEEYEIEDGCYLNYYCQFKNEEIIDNIIDLWLEKESPKVYGKQILTKPYRLKDLCGRTIIGVYPSYTHGDWNLLLEGGVKLSLADGESYFNKAITSDYLNIIEGRETVSRENYLFKLENIELLGNFIYIPVISLNDSIGLVILYNEKELTNELTVGKLVASIFAKKLDI